MPRDLHAFRDRLTSCLVHADKDGRVLRWITAFAQQQAPTITPALSEAQIQAALAEQALLQKWNGMLAEWYIAIEHLPSNVYTSRKVLNELLDQILRDERTIKDDIERLRLEAKLRGQSEPHVAPEDGYQWYRQQGGAAGLAAVRAGNQKPSQPLRHPQAQERRSQMRGALPRLSESEKTHRAKEAQSVKI
ncbi:MAG TPA: hypothetical protein VFA61_12875 [Candidatus Udaeobacter sp.]|nr:hypothetical protein [Candidatus Udaeobacter sp.]